MNKQYIKTIDPEKAHRLIYELDEISEHFSETISEKQIN